MRGPQILLEKMCLKKIIYTFFFNLIFILPPTAICNKQNALKIQQMSGDLVRKSPTGTTLSMHLHLKVPGPMPV
jgi:hypothetical protein